MDVGQNFFTQRVVGHRNGLTGRCWSPRPWRYLADVDVAPRDVG